MVGEEDQISSCEALGRCSGPLPPLDPSALHQNPLLSLQVHTRVSAELLLDIFED